MVSRARAGERVPLSVSHKTPVASPPPEGAPFANGRFARSTKGPRGRDLAAAPGRLKSGARAPRTGQCMDRRIGRCHASTGGLPSDRGLGLAKRSNGSRATPHRRSPAGPSLPEGANPEEPDRREAGERREHREDDGEARSGLALRSRQEPGVHAAGVRDRRGRHGQRVGLPGEPGRGSPAERVEAEQDARRPWIWRAGALPRGGSAGAGGGRREWSLRSCRAPRPAPRRPRRRVVRGGRASRCARRSSQNCHPRMIRLAVIREQRDRP